MPKVVQEKFQVTLPDSPEDNRWASFESARQSQSRVRARNQMPPGQNIEQDVADIRRMGMNTSGNMPSADAQGDVTNREVNGRSLREGFDKKRLLQTDDEYTREHNDAFYDDVGGFVERNNYLDRI